MPSGPRARVARAIGFSLLGLATCAGLSHAARPTQTLQEKPPLDAHFSGGSRETDIFELSPPASGRPEPATAFPLRTGWQRRLPGKELYTWQQAERAKPRLVGDELLVGTSRSPDVLVMDSRTGWLKRRIRTRGPVQIAPVVADDGSEIFVGDTAGYFYRLRLDGSQVWEYETPGPVTGGAAVALGRVFFHVIDGGLVALNASNGQQIWTYRREAVLQDGLAVFGASAPLVLPEGIVISGFDDGSVVALKADDGTLVWEVKLVSDGRWLDVDGDPVLLDGDRVFVASYGGPAVCLRAATGEELWRVPIGGSGRPLVREGVLYVPDSSGAVVALSAATGERLWRWTVPGGAVPNAPVWWRGTLVITSADGQLYLVDPKGRLLWQWKPDQVINGISSVVEVGEAALYVISDGGHVYQLTAPDYEPKPGGTERRRWE